MNKKICSIVGAGINKGNLSLIKNSDFKISLMLYDDEFIKNNYIYYYDDVICYCDSIYNLKAPVKGSMYFTGWYIDEACSVKYKERESRINKIYPRFSEYAMYNVDFYLEDKIIDRQWVLPGAKYDSVEVNGEFEFVRWEPYVLGVYSDLRLDAVILKEDECLVDFYDGNQLIDYRVVKKGSSVEIDDPIKQGYEFIGWYKEPECINEWNFDNDIVPAKIYNSDNEYQYQETILYAKWENIR